MFPFRSKVKELQKTITTLEGIIADNRHVTWKQYVQLQEAETAKQNLRAQLDTAWKTIRGNEEQSKQEQAMNETVEMSKLRGEISILKEELQRIKIVAEREKNRSDSFADLQQELEIIIKQRDELYRALQQIKTVAEQEKSRANWNYEQYNDLQQELEKTKEQRDELDREITCLHESFRQRVETEREQNASKAPAHCKEKTGIDAILAEREKTHGSFETHANCTQILEDTFYSFKPSLFYNSVMREGLHMIFHKLGRIAAGCATHKDHWDDIAGYATLVSRSLEEEKE